MAAAETEMVAVAAAVAALVGVRVVMMAVGSKEEDTVEEVALAEVALVVVWKVVAVVEVWKAAETAMVWMAEVTEWVMAVEAGDTEVK